MLGKLMFDGIIQNLEELNGDDEVRLIIVKGVGDYFCYGADVREILGLGKHKTSDFFVDLTRMLIAFYEVDKPIIAMVQGYATAGGFSLALSCDFIIASEDTSFGVTAVNVGLLCTHTTGVMLPRIVGTKKALEMGITGDLITASEAERLGIVNRVVPREKLESATMELAQKILSKNPVSIVLGRRAFYDCIDMDYLTGLKHAGKMLRQIGATEEAREGMLAFLAKRKPSYKRGTSLPPRKRLNESE
jgi:enoyl-CoA hydratase/carnithine racemase